MDRILIGNADGLTVVHEPRSADPRVSRLLPDVSVTALAGGHPESETVFVATFDDGLYRGRPAVGFERIATATIESNRVTAVASSPHDPAVVYAGTEPSRLYRTTDGGDTWAECDAVSGVSSADTWSFPPRPETHHVRWIEVDPNDPERLYVGIEAGALLVSADGGESWVDRPTGSRLDNHTLATHADTPGRVYAAAGDGFAQSDDWGQTWDHPQAGLEHRYVWGLAVDPTDPAAVVVSAASGASGAHRQGRAVSYRRRAPGESWTRIDDPVISPDGGCYRAIFAAGATMLAGVTDRGVAISDDGGASWQPVPVSVAERPHQALLVESSAA